MLLEHVGKEEVRGARAAMCGPKPLIENAEKITRSLGVSEIEFEDFDFRQGFGPDLSMILKLD